MSGFIALVNTDGTLIDSSLLEMLTNSLERLGPDKKQVWQEGAIGLGHTLFQTTRESQYEHQPATLDGNAWITGHIRIDGRKDLLGRLGITNKINLDRTPDSQLVLHAYRKWGEQCTENLLGDYAFAIWDKLQNKLFCAKDRFGMRQLYYARIKNNFVVSNSLQCMLSHPAITRRLNDQAIGGFLLFGDHEWLNKSITAFADVNVLRPAHTLTLSDKKLHIKRYWNLPVESTLLRYPNKNSYLEHFYEIFKIAVSDRIRCDDIVISLSGGMDSSAIAATAVELQGSQTSSNAPTAITRVYDEVHPCQERYYSGLAAKKLDISQHVIAADNFPLFSNTIKTSRPIEYGHSGYWLHFEKSIRALGRTVLTGEAGDNLLSYPATQEIFRESSAPVVLLELIKLTKRYAEIPGWGAGIKKKLKTKSLHTRGSDRSPYPYPAWINPDFESKAELQELWAAMWQPRTKQSQAQCRNTLLDKSLVQPGWCTNDLITNSDFAFSDHRDPFLDPRLIEFLSSVPALPWLFKKHILREAFKDKLPNAIINRPKTVLGNLTHSLLRRDMPQCSGSNQEESGRLSNQLGDYIDLNVYPKLSNCLTDPILLYINMRAILLNRWLLDGY